MNAERGASPPGLDSTRVRVPLLEELLAEANPERFRVWLDLGAAQDGLLLRLGQRRARLLVADLPAAIEQGQTPWHLPDALIAPSSWDRPVDRMLVWDLFDYLAAQQMRELGEQLSSHLSPQGRIHALVHYSTPGMPERPGKWRFDRDGALLHSGMVGTALVPAPRHSPKALEKAMPHLQVERTVLLNNGMQEFLLRLR